MRRDQAKKESGGEREGRRPAKRRMGRRLVLIRTKPAATISGRSEPRVTAACAAGFACRRIRTPAGTSPGLRGSVHSLAIETRAEGVRGR